MNKVSIILLLVVVSACSSSDHLQIDDIEKISVNVDDVSSDASSFIEKIEVLPLETNDSSLVSGYRKIMYNKDMDVYALYDKDQVVLTFAGNGNFIANSKIVQGEGPEEYNFAVDVKFNTYMEGVDFLNPYGVIYTYSPKFEFLSKRKIKSEFVLNSLMSLDSVNYIFTNPPIWTGQEVLFANLNTQRIDIANYEGMISSNNTMDQECFYQIGDNFYFIPKGINYYFYRIDKEKKELLPVIFLDFGDAEIKGDNLPGCAIGKRVDSDQEMSKNVEEIQERAQFLRKSNFVLPLIKFFNEDYIYIYILDNSSKYGGHFIFNRKSKQGYLVKDGTPFIMQICFGLVDNVLMAIADACYASKLVDTHLMSSEEISKMEKLKEDDNPVIIKYYLRK